MSGKLSDRLRLESALDLQRRLPPNMIEAHVAKMIDIAPDLCEDLLERIDQPLKMMRDDIANKDFLLCEYNRDGDSYRSPHTNQFFPDIEDGFQPPDQLRQLEIEMNQAFDQYRELYYDGGVCSVYLWETGKDNTSSFAGSILFKKAGDGSQKIKGCWDSIHIFEVLPYEQVIVYKLTTTVMLWLQTNTDDCGMLNLGGSLTRQFEKQSERFPSHSHICEIGKLVEEAENKIRTSLNTIYFGKTRDVVNSLRSSIPLSERDKNRVKLQAELGQRLSRDVQM